MARRTRNTAQIFLEEALKIDSEDCIVWPYSKHNYGYGVVFIDGKLKYVHRLALERITGKAPSGKPHALHKPLVCHNPSCFNYKHLRWGTRKENAADRKLDGDDRRGTRHPSNKLTEEQVISIFHDTRPQSHIVKDYNIHQVHVSQIKLGKVWGWLTKELKEKSYA